MNNNALTAMTAGMTRIHSTPITEIESAPAPLKRPTPAAFTPSVTVSLSEDVQGENSKAQQITEKFEHSISQIYGKDESVPSSTDTQSNEAVKVFELTPISLPGKADVAAFEELLNNEFAKAGIDTSVPIKLVSDGEGGITVSGDHPDKEKIENLFKDNPDLQQGYAKSQIYFTLQNIYQLHQQWQQKIESGMSEEAAGNWLINASKNAVNNSQVTLNNGKISGASQSNQLYT